MGVFRQLGDPLAAAECLCQHHGAAYAELSCTTTFFSSNYEYDTVANNTTIISAPITTTERCCVAVNAATIEWDGTLDTEFEIERPFGTIRTTQRDAIPNLSVILFHHAAWEVLDPGTYTYHLVNRSGGNLLPICAWLKIIASDCEA